MPDPKEILESLLNKQAPVKDELAEVQAIIGRSGYGPQLFSDLIAYVSSYRDYTMSIDTILGMQIPADPSIAEAIRARLTGDRQFIATMSGYYKAWYETSKNSFYPRKSHQAGPANDPKILTERERDRMQDAAVAVFEYLRNNAFERVKSIDATLVTCNRILERENILLKRGAAN